MMPADFELPIALHGHVARLFVRPADAGGYEVRAEVDAREIAKKHCSDWRRVERFRSQLQRRLQCPGADVVDRPRAHDSAA
jgi:hypothetical protein